MPGRNLHLQSSGSPGAATAFWKTFTEPEQVERAAQKIMTLSVPDDLEPKLAYEFFHMRVVTYSGKDETSQLIIYEMQADSSASDAEIQSQIEDTAAEGSEWMVDSRQIGVEHVTIAGRKVAVGIYESDLPEENNYRMASTIFRISPDRFVLVMLVRPTARWSLAEVRALFSSIQP